MNELFTSEQKQKYEEFLQFADNNIEDYSQQWEEKGEVTNEIIEKCKAKGYFGTTIPKEYGGQGWDTVTYGIFTEAIAKASTSFAGLFNVHTMVMQTIWKLGTQEQKDEWLPKLTKGEKFGAFALTEPGAGSDVKGIETKFERDGDNLVINGQKRWITFGCLADVVLLFGYTNDEKPLPTACLVETKTEGCKVTHIDSMLGFKAAHIAVIEFNHCVVKKENIIGRPGFGFSYISPYALDYGRVSVAFSALGILRGCLSYSCGHAVSREAFKRKLIEQSAIREMITKMGVDYEAACALCIGACQAKDAHTNNSAEKVMQAKYFTSRSANEHARNAVQILGAMGCNENHPVARYYRDSKILEIIEGSNQICEMILGNYYAREYQVKK